MSFSVLAIELQHAVHWLGPRRAVGGVPTLLRRRDSDVINRYVLVRNDRPIHTISPMTISERV